jgi:autotransporter translocation and assembly factor TamB
LTIFNRLNQILLIVTSLIVAVLLALGVWTYQNRNQLLSDGLREVERAASEAIGVPLKVGGISGPLWGGLSLRDVRVYGSNAPDAPVIAYAPEVRANYAILEILKLSDKPVQVDVYGARVTLARDAKGQISYQPKFKPATGEVWEPPKLPPIQIIAHGGAIQWSDTYQRKAPFQANLKGISARADLIDSVLTFSGNGKEQTSPLQVKGHYRLKGGSGAVAAEVSRIDVPRWATYLAPSTDWWATRGEANAQVDVKWQDPTQIETLDVNGKVQLRGAELEVRNLLRPLQAISADASFNLEDVTLSRVEAQLQGNRITGGGKVLGISKPWVAGSKTTGPTLDMAYTAHGVDLKSLEPLVKDLDQYELSGLGEVSAQVSGFAADPVVTADLQVPQARIVKQDLTQFTGQLRYQDMHVSIPTWNGKVHGGHVNGATTLRFGKGKPGTPEGDMRVETTASWHGVDLGALVSPYLEEPLPLKGAASGSIVVSGPATHLDVRGRAEVLNGAYGSQAIEAVSGAFHLAGKTWDVPVAVVRIAGGYLTAHARGSEGGSVTGRFQLADFPLDRLEAMGVEIPMAGAVTAEGLIGGNAQVPESIRVSGKAQGSRLIIDGQEITDALVRWSFAGTRLDLPRVEGKTAGGEVMGSGHLMLPKTSTTIPDFSFEVAAKDVEAGEIEPLQRILVEELGMVRGVMTLSAHVESQDQDLRFKGDLDAKQVDAERFGELERVSGPIYFGHHRLTLPELRAKPELGSQGDDGEILVKGDLDFSQLVTDPEGDVVANLTVSTIDANLRQIMEAVHWQQLLRGTWIGRRMVNESLGPGTPAGDLPGREDLPLLDGTPTSLAPLLDHWKAAKKEPLPSNELFLASRRPFWQAFEGRLSMDYEITGPLSDPDMRLRAHLRHGKAYGHRLETAQVSLSMKGDRLVVPYLSISSDDGGSLYAKGMLGPGQELVAYGDRLDLAWINPWLQAQELTLAGRAGVTLRAKGTLSDPNVSIDAEVNKGLLNEFAYDRARAKAVYAEGRLAIRESEVTKDGRSAHVTGSLPLPATPGNDAITMDMDLDGESLGLISIVTKGEVEWLGGPGAVKLALRGTLEEPKLTGNMELMGGTIGIKTLEGSLTNVVASASIGPKGVIVQRATAQYGGGKIVASGNLTMSKEFKPQDMRFQVSASQVDLKLKNKLYQGMTGATLEVTGKPDHPVISGIIALSRGTVQLPSGEDPNAAAPAEMIPVTLKDLTVQLGTGVQVSMGSALTDRATMKMDVTVTGNLLVNGMLDDPQPKGVILVRSGSFTTLNTDFRIVSEPVGRVEFLGGGLGNGGLGGEADDFMDILAPAGGAAASKSKLPNARLDVTAQARVWDYNGEDFRALTGKAEPDYLNVTAHVTGSLKNMEINFESNPPLSQDRILQVLGKESLITSTFRGDAGGPQTGDILRREVTEFISSGVGQFVNTAIDDWLVETGSKRFVDEFRMDLVSGIQTEEVAPELIPNVSLYGQTRPLGPLSLNARYTFRGNRLGDTPNGFQDYYQVGLNYRLNSIWSVQAGLDNGLPGLGQLPPLYDLKLDGVSVNVPITLKAQLRF